MRPVRCRIGRHYAWRDPGDHRTGGTSETIRIPDHEPGTWLAAENDTLQATIEVREAARHDRRPAIAIGAVSATVDSMGEHKGVSVLPARDSSFY